MAAWSGTNLKRGARAEERSEAARTEIEIAAPAEEVWEAIATDEGRERWLEDEREVLVEAVEEQRRLVWWWAGDETWTRVEVTLVPAVSSTRVVVTETRPAFPLEALAMAFVPAAVA